MLSCLLHTKAHPKIAMQVTTPDQLSSLDAALTTARLSTLRLRVCVSEFASGILKPSHVRLMCGAHPDLLTCLPDMWIAHLSSLLARPIGLGLQSSCHHMTPCFRLSQGVGPVASIKPSMKVLPAARGVAAYSVTTLCPQSGLAAISANGQHR